MEAEEVGEVGWGWTTQGPTGWGKVLGFYPTCKVGGH